MPHRTTKQEKKKSTNINQNSLQLNKTLRFMNKTSICDWINLDECSIIQSSTTVLYEWKLLMLFFLDTDECRVDRNVSYSYWRKKTM